MSSSSSSDRMSSKKPRARTSTTADLAPSNRRAPQPTSNTAASSSSSAAAASAGRVSLIDRAYRNLLQALLATAPQRWYPSRIVETSKGSFLDVAGTIALGTHNRVIVNGASVPLASVTVTPPEIWSMPTAVRANLRLRLGTWNIGGRYSDNTLNGKHWKALAQLFADIIGRTTAFVLQEIRANSVELLKAICACLNAPFEGKSIWKFVQSEPLSARTGTTSDHLREISVLFYRADVFVLVHGMQCSSPQLNVDTFLAPVMKLEGSTGNQRGLACFQLEVRDLDLADDLSYPLFPPVQIVLFSCHLQSGDKAFLNKAEKATKAAAKVEAKQEAPPPRFGQAGFNADTAYYEENYQKTNKLRQLQLEHAMRIVKSWYIDANAIYPEHDGPLIIPCLLGDFNQDVGWNTPSNKAAQLELKADRLFLTAALPKKTSTCTLTFLPSSLDNITFITNENKEECKFGTAKPVMMPAGVYVSDHKPIIATLRIAPGMQHSAEC